jgi:small subunit ribosomal protein S5
MTDTPTTTEEKKTTGAAPAGNRPAPVAPAGNRPAPAAPVGNRPAPAARQTGPQGRGGGDNRRGGGGNNDRRQRRQRRREPRARSEFENAILGIRRVTRVVAGGRRFSFSVTIVIGNGRGQVGVGLGKAMDTALAIEKATKNAKRHLIQVPIAEGATIPHEVKAKYAAAQIILIPTPGKGLKAGSAVRTVLELAGIRNVSGKILSRSKNPLNNARATVLALSRLKPARKKKEAEKKDEKKTVNPKKTSK